MSLADEENVQPLLSEEREDRELPPHAEPNLDSEGNPLPPPVAPPPLTEEQPGAPLTERDPEQAPPENDPEE